MIARFCNLSVAGLVLGLTMAGCSSSNKEHPADSGHSEAGHDEHAHPSEGPHGGSLTELGNDDYHAEIVHDDAAGTVTIYMLDSAAKAVVPIEATEITINLKHEGRGEQFKLRASADASDPAGKSSRFVSTDKELAEDLDHDGAEPQLVVTVNGKQYRGAIAHDHDEEGGHHHEGDDALMWQRSDVQHAGYSISLGHHSKLLHAGEPVEPAVSITRDGQPVADAQVYNSLWNADGTTMLVEEMPTVYEPSTEAEPAHYAQGALKFPGDAKSVVLRFRIVLPGNAGDVSYDVPVALHN